MFSRKDKATSTDDLLNPNTATTTLTTTTTNNNDRMRIIVSSKPNSRGGVVNSGSNLIMTDEENVIVDTSELPVHRSKSQSFISPSASFSSSPSISFRGLNRQLSRKVLSERWSLQQVHDVNSLEQLKKKLKELEVEEDTNLTKTKNYVEIFKKVVKTNLFKLINTTNEDNSNTAAGDLLAKNSALKKCIDNFINLINEIKEEHQYVNEFELLTATNFNINHEDKEKLFQKVDSVIDYTIKYPQLGEYLAKLPSTSNPNNINNDNIKKEENFEDFIDDEKHFNTLPSKSQKVEIIKKIYNKILVLKEIRHDFFHLKHHIFEIKHLIETFQESHTLDNLAVIESLNENDSQENETTEHEKINSRQSNNNNKNSNINNINNNNSSIELSESNSEYLHNNIDTNNNTYQDHTREHNINDTIKNAIKNALKNVNNNNNNNNSENERNVASPSNTSKKHASKRNSLAVKSFGSPSTSKPSTANNNNNFSNPTNNNNNNTFNGTFVDPNDLQLFSNYGNGMMLTRSYRETPLEKEFKEALKEAENPLLLIFQQYADLLPTEFKSKLLSASLLENKVTENLSKSSSIRVLFQNMLVNILNVEKLSNEMLKNVVSGEKIVKGLIAINVVNEFVDVEVMGDELTALYT
jgi:hypothetical protein